MQITKRAETLLLSIARTEDAAVKLTDRNARAANELVNAGYAVRISAPGGGSEVALTRSGMTAAGLE